MSERSDLERARSSAGDVVLGAANRVLPGVLVIALIGGAVVARVARVPGEVEERARVPDRVEGISLVREPEAILPPAPEPEVLFDPVESDPPIVHREPMDPSLFPSIECRNSTKRRCGPFRWSTPPEPNELLEVNVGVAPQNPRAGQPVRLDVRAIDPDAPVQCCVIERDDGPQIGTAMCLIRRFGVWDPPPRARGEERARQTYIFDEPGTYQVNVWATSGSWTCGDDPYGDAVIERVIIDVGSDAGAPPA